MPKETGFKNDEWSAVDSKMYKKCYHYTMKFLQLERENAPQPLECGVLHDFKSGHIILYFVFYA